MARISLYSGNPGVNTVVDREGCTCECLRRCRRMRAVSSQSLRSPVYLPTLLPVRHAVHIRCASYREGCLYTHSSSCKAPPTIPATNFSLSHFSNNILKGLIFTISLPMLAEMVPIAGCIEWSRHIPSGHLTGRGCAHCISQVGFVIDGDPM